METVRLTGSDRIQIEVEDRYTERETGCEYGIIVLNGDRIPVIRYPDSEVFFLDAGEVIR